MATTPPDPDSTQLPVITAEALVIRPGDTLILRAEDIAPDVAEEIRAQLSRKLAGVEIVLVGNCQQMAAYRPGSESPGITGYRIGDRFYRPSDVEIIRPLPQDHLPK